MSTPAEILVVEDEPVMARTLVRVFRAAGYVATFVSSCAEARSVGRPYEIAVLDIDLGDGDGVTLARELLAANAVGCVVFHTATSDAEQHARALELGAVVTKSGDPAILLSEISDALNRA